jgi:hypothetical protein
MVDVACDLLDREDWSPTARRLHTEIAERDRSEQHDALRRREWRFLAQRREQSGPSILRDSSRPLSEHFRGTDSRLDGLARASDCR